MIGIVYAPSTLPEGGFLECIRFEHIADSPNETVFEGLIGGVDRQLGDQALRARQFVAASIQHPWIGPLVVRELSKGRLTIAFDQHAERQQSSFGLAFAIGMLSLALDLPTRERLAHTGEIEAPFPAQDSSGRPTILMRMRQVSGLTAKALCCAKAQYDALYFPFEIETAEFQRIETEFASNNPSFCCPLLPLSQNLSAANLINLAFDLPAMWNRASSHEYLPLAVTLLDHTTFNQHENEFPLGIGEFLSGLRQQDLVPTSIQGYLHHRIKSWRNAVSPKHHPELLKALISDDPMRPLDASSADDPVVETDINHWLRNVDPGDAADVFATLQLVKLCADVSIDFDRYLGAAHGVFMRSLNIVVQLIDNLVSSTERAVPIEAIGQLISIGHEFVSAAIGIAPSACTELAQTLERLNNPIDRIADANETFKCVQALKALRERCLSAAALSQTQPVSTRNEQLLKMIFSLSSGEPQGTRINELNLEFTVGDITETMAEPALLFDSSATQCGDFSRRHRFSRNDDAFFALPESTASVIELGYSSPRCAIGFKLSTGTESLACWDKNHCGWPPAIDSQLFAAAIDTHGDQIKPKSVIDVGTGTGFLAGVALSRWSSIKKMVLVESDRGSALLAKSNLVRYQGCNLEMIPSRFQAVSFNDRCDLLICHPPYLPQRPLVPGGIEMATNGTSLLEAVVKTGHRLASEIWMSFSMLAWPDFAAALLHAREHYSRIEILARNFVPFRIPWLEPRAERGSRDPNVDYYENVLLKRGLLDLDSPDNDQLPVNYLEHVRPGRGSQLHPEIQDCSREQNVLRDRLSHLRKNSANSHGYRYWHEIRVVRLITK